MALVVLSEAVPLQLKTQAHITLLTFPGSAPFAESALLSLHMGVTLHNFSRLKTLRAAAF